MHSIIHMLVYLVYPRSLERLRATPHLFQDHAEAGVPVVWWLLYRDHREPIPPLASHEIISRRRVYSIRDGSAAMQEYYMESTVAPHDTACGFAVAEAWTKLCNFSAVMLLCWRLRFGSRVAVCYALHTDTRPVNALLLAIKCELMRNNNYLFQAGNTQSVTEILIYVMLT